MRQGTEKIVVLSKNSSSLFGYAKTLNDLGFYSLSLCNHVREVVDQLESGKCFEYMIYDAFDLRKDSKSISMITKYCGIFSIIAIADMNSQQRQKISVWAKTHGIPLQGVLQTPLRSPELYKLIESIQGMQF